MVQPKMPPLSIRPGSVRLAEIDAYALKHGLKRHAAVLELLDLALKGPVGVATGQPTPKPVPGSDAAKRNEAAGAARPSPTKVNIPFAGDVQRRPIQKTGKR